MTLRCGSLPRHPRGRREFLNHVADIANILNAGIRAGEIIAPLLLLPVRRTRPPPIPIDVLMVLPSVCALAQHEGDHRREADQADHDQQ